MGFKLLQLREIGGCTHSSPCTIEENFQIVTLIIIRSPRRVSASRN